MPPTVSQLNEPIGGAAGTRFGKYLLLAPIGAGGMGQVWIAQHAGEHAFRRTVALKLIRSEHAANAEFRRMFLAEARIAARVSHANVVEVIDLGEHDAQLYQVMEYVEGDSFSQLLARGRAAGEPLAPIPVVARIVVDALRGLHAAHEMTDDRGTTLGFVHRDVSPHNVLVGIDGNARIADFGIAKLLSDLASETAMGQVKGKPGYMAPEQARGAAVDRRSDLYAMGIVAWEGLTGRRLGARAESLADGRPDVDERFAAAIAKALALAPDDRFGSAEEMADVLESTRVCATSREVATWVKTLAGTAIEAKRAEMQRVAHGVEAARAPQGEAERAATQIEHGGPAGPGFAHDRTVGAAALPGRSLAVLPFRYRGPPEDEYLAEAFGEELVDVLSRTSGLRVFASAAVSRFKTERDPGLVRDAIGAEVIIDATLQRAGTEVRVGVRLIDATSGVQLWSEPFSGAIEESFRLQETMSLRIAEALRVELSVRSTSGAVPGPGVELCLRARRKLRAFRLVGPDGAIDLLEQSLALAPRLAPAIATYAIAAVRAWFVPTTTNADGMTEDRARRAVARALAEAPSLVESQFAAALLALHVGDFSEAVARLGRVLAIAPHYPDALSMLGALECETGMGERGRPRLELAFELSPDLTTAYSLANHHALHGRAAAFDAVMARSVDLLDATGLVILEMRVAFWHGDRPRIERAFDRLHLTAQVKERFEPYAKAAMGTLSLDDADVYFQRVTSGLSNGRMRTLFFQIASEIFSTRGDLERGQHYLKLAANALLLDLDWLDRCPALVAIRGTSTFGEARELVAGRARSLRDE